MSEPCVLIISHNSAQVIDRCLESCAGLDTIVIDNASTDSTVRQVESRPGVTLIANPTNRGFAAAVNQGVQSGKHEFFLLLNPDAELLTSTGPLLETCSLPNVGIAGGKLVDAVGNPQIGFNIRRFPTAWTLAFEALGLNRMLPRNGVNRRYRCLNLDLNQQASVEQPAGAFLLFRRTLWQQIGGFDTRFYPIWFEDVDFCKRARDTGWKIQYVPAAVARHLGAHSISQLQWASREVYWYAGFLRYASKHFHPWAFRGVSAAVLLGSLLRAVVGVAVGGSFKPVAVYARVVRLAASSFWAGRISERVG